MKTSLRSGSVYIALSLFSVSGIYAQDLKTYQNYDFTHGEKIIFEDDFTDSRDGEFPPHWKLRHGQGAVNKLDGKSCFVVTEGGLGGVTKVDPLIKDKTLSRKFIYG